MGVVMLEAAVLGLFLGMLVVLGFFWWLVLKGLMGFGLGF